MKKIILSLIYSFLITTFLSAREYRVLYPLTSCSGTWQLFDSETHQLTGWGTYNHCGADPGLRKNGTKTEESMSEIFTQNKDDDFLIVQPAVESKLIPTKEDVEKVKKQEAKIKIYPNPSKVNDNVRFQLEEQFEGSGTYSIIGYDGKEYVRAKKIQINNGQFEVNLDFTSSGVYFIILTYSDKTVSNNFKVL